MQERRRTRAATCGTNPTTFPSGCTGPNGLFNGDGTGCSKTCTKEPICRDASGQTQKCATSCGNGNIEAGEQCDDGNLNDNDGCSKTCMLEGKFMCTPTPKPDTQTCTQSINSGQCLELPVKYRDFKSEHETGGHPDFFYYGSTVSSPVTVTSTTHGAIPFAKRYCVPNSSGPARKNDSTARCWDMAQANLDAKGKPAFNTTRNGGGANAALCDRQFTDGGHDGGTVTTSTAATATRRAWQAARRSALRLLRQYHGSPWYKGPAPVVSSATTFGQWWATAPTRATGRPLASTPSNAGAAGRSRA